jgi:hypothetical protein
MKPSISWHATSFWDGQRLKRLGAADDHQIDALLAFPPDGLSDDISDSLPSEKMSDGLSKEKLSDNLSAAQSSDPLDGLQKDWRLGDLDKQLPPGTLLIRVKTASLKALSEAPTSLEVKAFE